MFENMFELLVQNLWIVVFGCIVLALSMLSNIFFSVWYNTKIVKEKFSWTLFWEGIVKIIVFVLGLSCLTIAISIIPTYISFANITIGELNLEPDTLIYLDILIVSVAFLTVSLAYIKQAVLTFKDIISKKK